LDSRTRPTAAALGEGDGVISVDSTPSSQKQRSLEHACLCAKTADDYRCTDTLVLDLTGVTPVVDYFVLTTGTSKRQMHALADEVKRLLQAEGSGRLGLEGYETGTWILEDFGDIVLHVFTAETRKIYSLEQLWADAPQVDWRSIVERSKSN